MSNLGDGTRHILYNLEEAREEIDLVIRDLKRGGYTEERFRRALAHAVHHTNIAWNGRATSRDIGEATEESFTACASESPQLLRVRERPSPRASSSDSDR